MKRSPIRRKPPTRDPEHDAATALAGESACRFPGCTQVGCVPAHWPHHRRRRTWPRVWDVRNWIPLCPEHHDFIDGRTGGVINPAACEARGRARAYLAIVSPMWWWSQHPGWQQRFGKTTEQGDV
jgi:hypothetical protein